MPEPAPLQQFARTQVRSNGRNLIYFAGCDYFRLSSHPQVIRALHEGARKYGLNVAASRLTTGNHLAYQELEQALAAFFKAPAALVTPDGYASNCVVAQALQGEFSLALIDERAHPSLQDAARFLQCPVRTFKHRDWRSAEKLLMNTRPSARVILLTDGLFSHDGEAAPVNKYLEVLPANGIVLLDDAHGAGLLGENGRGTPEYLGIARKRVIQTITLSKAFGVFGGAVLSSADLREKIIAKSGMFIGSTPLPLPLAVAARKAVEILKSNRALRERLSRNATRVKTVLRARGLVVADTPAPIIRVVPKDREQGNAIRRKLAGCGIFPSFIKYPGGPPEGYFRFVISSEHTRAQLDKLLEALDFSWNETAACASKPRLVAIIGGSGSGKTYLAGKLAAALGGDVLRLTLDDFYRDRSGSSPAARAKINFDHPRAMDWAAFERVLLDLSQGRSARVPRYDFATHTRLAAMRRVEPRAVILVEGLWPCHRARISKLFDLRIFLESGESLRFERRLKRDVAERGRDAESVKRQFYESVAPMHLRFVVPQMRAADIVFRRPLNDAAIARLAKRITQNSVIKDGNFGRQTPARP
jgi:7-keto-8-aminopelargonate synthetase-like enzyme/uridine kinase